MTKKKTIIVSVVTAFCILVSAFFLPTINVSAHNGYLTWENDAKLLGGVGNTVYNFSVEKVYKGNLKENDLISVLTAGGYARLSKHIEVFGDEKFSDFTAEQINNTVLKTDFMESPTPKIGDKYLLFLSAPTNNENPFPDGLYSEVGTFMGRYVDTNNNFSRHIPEDEVSFYKSIEEPFSLKQMETRLEKSRAIQTK